MISVVEYLEPELDMETGTTWILPDDLPYDESVCSHPGCGHAVGVAEFPGHEPRFYTTFIVKDSEPRLYVCEDCAIEMDMEALNAD